MNEEGQLELFRDAPIWKSACRLALPTVMGQIILVLYNMADTFFIGLTADDAKITALTIAMPCFMILSAISNLFGIGGSGAVSRALGAKNPKRAKDASFVSFWGTFITTAAYMVLVALLASPIVDMLGGTEARVHGFTIDYILITVSVGGMATSLAALMSHLMRAEGKGFVSSFGIALGGIMNIALDPLFMFVIMPEGMEVTGAAIATALSNLASLLFFAIVHMKERKKSIIRLTRNVREIDDSLVPDILSSGLPACIMTVCENASYAVLDKIISSYGVTVQAGLGVAKKINMLAHSIVRGTAQGMLPLIAWNYAAGNMERMKKASRFSTGFGVAAATLCMAFSLIFALPLVDIFLISGSESSMHAARFLRILALGGPFSALAYTAISFFQATGKGMKAFVLALMRKGILDIPMMVALDIALPVWGAPIATPIADALCAAAALAMMLKFMKTIHSEVPERKKFKMIRVLQLRRAVV